MASSKVVLATNPDQPRNSSSSSSSSISTSSHNSLSTLFLHLSDSDHHHHPMDDLLNSIYPTTAAAAPPPKNADDVWKEIVAGNSSGTHHNNSNGEGLDVVTLEDYLIKERALPVSHPSATAGAGVSSAMVQFGNGVDGTVVGTSGGGGGGKGRRRVIEETVDKATLQKQRRMIKNRESAARSRERKQAYTSELEYLVHQLEQENAGLLSEEADKQQQRFKQLTEYIIPIEERPGPPNRRFRRTDSAQSM